MFRRFVARFEPGRPNGEGLFSLVVSDYLAFYRPTPERDAVHVGCNPRIEAPRRLALLFLPRLLHNPSLHAAVLIRLAGRSPRFTLGLWRTLLIAKHSIDIQADIKIGPGLLFPHPLGIVFGWGVEIGRDVTVLHNVTIGGVARRNPDEMQLSPIIQDHVIIFTESIVLGPITVGERAVLGAGSWVTKDVAPRTVHPGRAALFRSAELLTQ